MGEQDNLSAVQNHGLMGKILSTQEVMYFVKAIVLMACLTLVAKIAPHLPSVIIPLVLLAYAALSTAGALYFTVVNRLHKQKKLAKEGKISRLNRKWLWMMVGFLILSVASAFLFLLNAPTWDGLEWILVWVAVPLYFVAFKVAAHFLRREYAPKYYKAQAMRCSFWVVGVLLCLVYAFASIQLHQVAEYAGLEEAFRSIALPYQDAPSALMHEAEKVSSFTDGLATYAVSQVSNSFFLLGVACQFVVFASVIFCVLNQLRFCFLNWTEIRSELQILPADDDNEAKSPILKRYVIAISVVALTVLLLFLAFEFEVAKAQAVDDYTAIDEYIEAQKENVIHILGDGFEKGKEYVENRENYESLKEDLVEQRDEGIRPLIDEYYNRCLGNIGSYLDWYYSPFGAFARQFKGMMRDDAVKTFKERVTDGSSAAEIEDKYNEYRNAMVALDNEMLAATLGDEASELIVASSRKSINLWVILENSEGPAVIDGYLLNTEEDMDREHLEEKIKELIEMARESTLSFLEEN